MSDTKYWRIRDLVEKFFEEIDRPVHYSELLPLVDNVRDTFYMGMIVKELILQGKLGWDRTTIAVTHKE